MLRMSLRITQKSECEEVKQMSSIFPPKEEEEEASLNSHNCRSSKIKFNASQFQISLMSVGSNKRAYDNDKIARIKTIKSDNEESRVMALHNMRINSRLNVSKICK